MPRFVIMHWWKTRVFCREFFSVYECRLYCWYIETSTECPQFIRQYVYMHLLEWNCEFRLRFYWVCSRVSNWQWVVIIVSGNGFASNDDLIFNFTLCQWVNELWFRGDSHGWQKATNWCQDKWPILCRRQFQKDKEKSSQPMVTNIMMTSSNRNIFRATGPLFTGHRWIPLTKASGAEFWCSLWSAPE